MVDAIRSSRATLDVVETTSTAGRATELAYGAGVVAIAATVTVTMALSAGPSAKAAMQPSSMADNDGSGLTPVKLNPTVPHSEQDLGARRAPRPPLRDHGSLTAALDAGDARTDTAAVAANPVAKAQADENRLIPGFAKPKTVGKSLGRLAEELPAPRSKSTLPQYAALGMAARSSGKSYSSSRLSGNISTGGKTTSCLPSDIKRVLNEAAARFGHLRINSTHRSHSHNRRVGGAPRSLHLECRAVDFAYHGSRRGALIKFLRNHGDVGGLGVYGSGHIHIDDGPHRTW